MPQPRTIAMTAEAMEDDRVRCLATRMDDYLAKPIRLEELRRALGDCRPVTTHAVRDVSVPPQKGFDRDVLDEPREDLGDPERSGRSRRRFSIARRSCSPSSGMRPRGETGLRSSPAHMVSRARARCWAR